MLQYSDIQVNKLSYASFVPLLQPLILNCIHEDVVQMSMGLGLCTIIISIL